MENEKRFRFYLYSIVDAFFGKRYATLALNGKGSIS